MFTHLFYVPLALISRPALIQFDGIKCMGSYANLSPVPNGFHLNSKNKRKQNSIKARIHSTLCMYTVDLVFIEKEKKRLLCFFFLQNRLLK